MMAADHAPRLVRSRFGKCKALVVSVFLCSPVCLPAEEVASHRLEAAAVQGAVKVDGVVEDAWRTVPRLKVRKSVPGLAGSDASDLATATVQLRWDDQHLYALFEVTDVGLHSNSPDPWEHDSVELFLDEKGDHAAALNADDQHVRVNFDGKLSGGESFIADSFQSAARKTEGGYRVECALRWKTPHPVAQKMLGLELQVNDNRDGSQRGGITKWSLADNESYRSTLGYGTLKLVGPVLDAAGTAAAAPAAKAAAQGKVKSKAAAKRQRKKKGLESPAAVDRRMPAWAADAVFYQIFPERFCNGDTSNDPTVESLEFPEIMPVDWKVTRWTADWYARDKWEQAMGDDFFEPAVFHRRYGGDLQGVLDRLDYLKRLGINAIYFNPVFYARSLHKYDGNSYHHVDPHFGPDPRGDLALMAKESSDPATWQWTAADRLFLKVVAGAHQRGMRVIIDGVFNHTGRGFFAFDDIVKRQAESDYTDWYVVHDFDDPTTDENELKYQCWWGVDTLPEFANNEQGTNLHVGPKKYIFAATKRWMDPNGDGDPADGIDGWRLDVANEVPDQFWVEWNDWVRQINAEAYTVSEIWEGAADYLRRCGFSASMNYHAFAYVAKGFLLDGRMTANEFVQKAESRRADHPWRIQLGMQNLFDSHDTDRVASQIVNAPRGRSYVKAERADYDIQERASIRHWDEYQIRKPNDDERRIQKLATLFQMSYVGAPMVYYGTEAGMWGGDDPCDRKPMVWADLEYDSETSHPRGRARKEDAVQFDDSLADFYRRMIAMRAKSRALRQGNVLAITGFDTAQSVAMLRQIDGDWALVMLNRSTEDQTIRLSAVDFPAPPSSATVHTTDEANLPKIESEPQHVSITLPRLSASCWTWEVE